MKNKIILISICFFLFSGIFINCNQNIKAKEKECEKALIHITKCMTSQVKNKIYFDNWENVCNEIVADSIISLSCNEVKRLYFEEKNEK